MTAQVFSDETLLAFADGELDAATTADLRAALDRDPALAKRVAVFRTTRIALKTALGPIEREAVPDHLTRFVMARGQTHSHTRAQPLQGGSRIALPLAAALACIVIGGGGYWMGSRSGLPSGSGTFAVAAVAEPELQRILAAAPDGASRTWREGGHSGEVVLRATYPTQAGICRSFSLSDSSATGKAFDGVACLGPAGWQTQVVELGRSLDGRIAPASGGGQAVDAFLDSVSAEDALGAAAVRSLIANGWRR